MSNISILARCTGTKIYVRWEEVLRVHRANFGANILCDDICDGILKKSTECLCLQQSRLARTCYRVPGFRLGSEVLRVELNPKRSSAQGALVK